MSEFTTVTVAATGVAIVAINKVAAGEDPFPGLLAGGLFTFGCVLLSGIDEGMGTALAACFLIGALLTNGTAVLSFITSVSNQK